MVTAPGESIDRAPVDERLKSGIKMRDTVISKADEVLTQLRVLQTLMREQLSTGPEYDLFSRRLEALKEVEKILDKVKENLKGTNKGEDWQNIVNNGISEILDILKKSAQNNGNKTFFEGLARAISDISRAAEFGKRTEDTVYLPHNVDYGHVLPRIQRTEQDLINSGFPKPETREQVKAAVFSLITTLGQQNEERTKAQTVAVNLVEDFVVLFEEEQKLLKSINEGKKTLKIDEAAIRDREKLKFDERRHALSINLRDNLSKINREQRSPGDAARLEYGRIKDDISRLNSAEEKSVEDAIKAAYEEAARLSGKPDYLKNIEKLEEITDKKDQIERFLGIFVDTSKKIKVATETILGTNDHKKSSEDKNSETVELMRNLDFVKAVGDVEESKQTDTSFSTTIDISAQYLGIANLNKRLMDISNKYISQPEETPPAAPTEPAPAPFEPPAGAQEGSPDETQHPEYAADPAAPTEAADASKAPEAALDFDLGALDEGEKGEGEEMEEGNEGEDSENEEDETDPNAPKA